LIEFSLQLKHVVVRVYNAILLCLSYAPFESSIQCCANQCCVLYMAAFTMLNSTTEHSTVLLQHKYRKVNSTLGCTTLHCTLLWSAGAQDTTEPSRAGQTDLEARYSIVWNCHTKLVSNNLIVTRHVTTNKDHKFWGLK